MTAPNRRGLLQLGLFLLLALGLPALVPHHDDNPAQSSRTTISIKEQLNRLEEEKPDIVIIGDSMVPCRADASILTSELGRRVSLLTFNGSASASWFLLFKNVVAEMEQPPAQVVFFFRDTYFHMPRYRTTGQRLAILNSLSLGAEPELEMVLTGDATQDPALLNAFDDLLDAAWQIDDYRAATAEKIRSTAMKMSRLETKNAERRVFMDDVFAVNKLRPDLAADFSTAEGGREHSKSDIPPWSIDPMKTFLPHLQTIAEQGRIQFIFYRVKQRRHADGSEPDSPELQSYLASFQNWIGQAGHHYVDETTDPGILTRHFADGDHLKEKDLPFISTRVAALLKPATKAP